MHRPLSEIVADNFPLREAAAQAVLLGWNIPPMGTQTKEELADRIAVIFEDAYGKTWTGGVTPEEILASGKLDEIVARVSAVARRKGEPPYEPSLPKESMPPLSWGVVAMLGAVGLLGYVIYKESQK